MRHGLIAVVAIAAGLISAAESSHSAPSTVLTAPTARFEGGLFQRCQIFPLRYYRQYPYGAPPVVVVPPAVPVVPPAAVEEPVIVVPPPRPASCGEYRYWNGEYCVDARYNTPY